MKTPLRAYEIDMGKIKKDAPCPLYNPSEGLANAAL